MTDHNISHIALELDRTEIRGDERVISSRLSAALDELFEGVTISIYFGAKGHGLYVHYTGDTRTRLARAACRDHRDAITAEIDRVLDALESEVNFGN